MCIFFNKYVFYNQKAGNDGSIKYSARYIIWQSHSKANLRKNNYSLDLAINLNADEIRIYNDFDDDKQGKRNMLPKKLIANNY